jgi:hypothetical protein
MPTDFRTVPGLYTGNQFVTRQVVRSLSSRDYLPSGVIIDGSLTRDIGSSPTSVLRAGLLMGKVTTGGKYRESIIGVTNGAIGAATITTITVAAPVATEVARLLAVAGGNITLRLFGPPSAAGTNAATNLTVTAAAGTTITFSSTAVPAYVDKSLIQATDGSQLPLTMIADPSGIDVTAMDATTNIDQMLGRWLAGADVYSNMVIAGNTDMTALDASLQTWIKQQLNGGGTSTRGRWTFSDEVP